MGVVQPAAKMLVELSKSQDIVAGDGTTTGMYSALVRITLFSSQSTLTFSWEVEKKNYL
jgi:chaperonin GroEL (HSP60 family)